MAEVIYLSVRWTKFDYSSVPVQDSSLFSPVIKEELNLGFILTKYSRKTKPQLLNKATGSFKWIKIFSMWLQSTFKHFSLLICRAMQRKRASSPLSLPDCHTDYFKHGRKSFRATFTNPQLWYNCAVTFFLTDIRHTKAENLKLKFRHDRLEAWTMN